MAARKVSFDLTDPDANYRAAMQMKLQCDNALKNNQRQPKDLAVLYKRLILTVDRTVGPMLRSYQMRDQKYARMLASVNQAAIDSGEKFN